MAGKLDGRRGIKRLLTKGYKVKHNNGNKIACFYANARSLRNKFEELRAYVSQDKPDIIFITETWVKSSVQNNKFSKGDSLNKYYLEGYILFQYERKRRKLYPLRIFSRTKSRGGFSIPAKKTRIMNNQEREKKLKTEVKKKYQYTKISRNL